VSNETSIVEIDAPARDSGGTILNRFLARYRFPRLMPNTMPNVQAAATLIQSFHELWYESRIWANEVTWRGVPCQKCPLDLWRFRQIITTL
jgi:hypothetical protein